jgi:hypothetical protein
MAWDFSLLDSMDNLIPMRVDDGKVVFFAVPTITHIGRLTDEITRRRSIPRNARDPNQLPSHGFRGINEAVEISDM